MIKKVFKPKILKYLFVGICTVAIDYLTIFISYNLLSLNYIISVCFGFLISNVFQFYVNFFYTFNLRKDNLMVIRISIFWLVVFIGNALSLLFIIILKVYITDLFIVKTLSLPLSFLYGYIASNKIIYNQYFYNYLCTKVFKCKKYL